MNKFTEKELEELGFEKQYENGEFGGRPFTYYTFDFERSMTLISGGFEDGVKETTVEFFEGEKSLSKKLVKTIVEEYGQ